jgi:hypothetical protein
MKKIDLSSVCPVSSQGHHHYKPRLFQYELVTSVVSHVVSCFSLPRVFSIRHQGQGVGQTSLSRICRTAMIDK